MGASLCPSRHEINLEAHTKTTNSIVQSPPVTVSLKAELRAQTRGFEPMHVVGGTREYTCRISCVDVEPARTEFPWTSQEGARGSSPRPLTGRSGHN